MHKKDGPIRVIHVLPIPRFYTQHGGVGGHIAHAVGIITALIKCGCEVRTLAGDAPLVPMMGMPANEVLADGSPGFWARQRWSARLVKRLQTHCDEQRVDLVYVRYSQQFAPWLPLLCRACRPARVVVEVNSFASQYRRWARPLESWALRSADLITVVSNDLAKAVAKLSPHFDSTNVMVIPNGVDVKRFSDAVPRAVPGRGTCNVAYVGILKYGHGLEQIVTCARILKTTAPGVVIHLVGEGPARSGLEKMAGVLPNLKFHGAIESGRVPSILQAMDILLYTTSVELAFQSPIKILEYMAAGRAIVAMRTSATNALLEAGAGGILVPLGDADAMATTIVELSKDHAARARMGRAAALIARKHTWKSRVQGLLTRLQINPHVSTGEDDVKKMTP